MYRLAAALVLFCLSFAALAELRLKLDVAGLNEAERRVSSQLLAEALHALPPSLVQRLDRSVPIAWSSRLPEKVMGRASLNGQMLLNRRWLRPLVAGAKPALLSQRSHGSLRQELLATLIHELGHVYDRGAYWAAPVRQMQLACRRLADSAGPVGLPARCHGQTRRSRSLSDDPRLLDLAGWLEQSGGRGARGWMNRQPERSPDPYELTSPAEFVAVNLEYFLLDPQYACRRPALYDYFSQHFGWAPPTVPCEPGFPFVRAGLEERQEAVATIDPARLYAVHYLLAEPNQQWASRWGHSMLRLVICAPGREPGPGCLLDLEHHLVLSFRAFVDDLQLSSWDGLTGEYPSRLFILPLGQVIDEYTRLELRGLQSIPLALTPTQRTALVRQAAQLHWSYDGRYYFVSNNCAVETLRLLRVGTGDARLTGIDTVTPTGVLELLEARGLADRSVLNDRSAAMRNGYYFDSYQQRQQKMLEVLQQELNVPSAELEQWHERPAAQRRALLETATNLRVAAALLLLEQTARDRQLLLARQELKRMYLNGDDAAVSGAGRLMEQLLADSAFFSRPAALISAGYGLPIATERDAMQNDAQARQRRLTGLADSLIDIYPALLETERQEELQHSQRNVELIAQRLKSMHAEAGGLQLP